MTTIGTEMLQDIYWSFAVAPVAAVTLNAARYLKLTSTALQH